MFFINNCLKSYLKSSVKNILPLTTKSVVKINIQNICLIKYFKCRLEKWHCDAETGKDSYPSRLRSC